MSPPPPLLTRRSWSNAALSSDGVGLGGLEESLPWTEFLVSLTEESKGDRLFVDGGLPDDDEEDRNEPKLDEVRLPCSDSLFKESTESLDRRLSDNFVRNEDGLFPDWSEEGVNTLSPDMDEEREDGPYPDRGEFDGS